MNKLSKDQLQKIGLSAIGFVALLYVYFSFFLGPLNKGRETAQRTMADLQSKIASSKTETQKAQNLERQAEAASARFAAMKALNPEGAPIAWFPPRMKSFFANHSIEKATVRADSNAPFKEAEMAEWTKHVWQIDLPQTDYVSAGKAIADLENSEPLISIARVSIKAVADTPQFQQVSLTAHSAIMKR